MAPHTDPSIRKGALALLGLPETATETEIAAAYRRLVRATHPDATGRTDPEAAREFAAIHDAYQLLVRPAETPAPHPVGDPATNPATDRAVDRIEPTRRYVSGAAPAADGGRPARPSTSARTLAHRPPIVAGPVIVTPHPDQQQPHPRRRP